MTEKTKYLIKIINDSLNSDFKNPIKLIYKKASDDWDDKHSNSEYNTIIKGYYYSVDKSLW